MLSQGICDVSNFNAQKRYKLLLQGILLSIVYMAWVYDCLVTMPTKKELLARSSTLFHPSHSDDRGIKAAVKKKELQKKDY